MYRLYELHRIARALVTRLTNSRFAMHLLGDSSFSVRNVSQDNPLFVGTPFRAAASKPRPHAAHAAEGEAA